jgi:ketosteroid isomerase-like protein
LVESSQVAVVEKFFRLAFHGSFAETVDDLDPNVTYHVPGTHQLAGTFVGPDAVSEHVAKLLHMTSDRVDVIQWEDWLQGINNVAGVVHVRFQRERAIADTRLVYLVAVSDSNKIRRIELFFGDQAVAERFFS